MPAPDPNGRPTRRGGTRRPSVGARGAVRVPEDFASEFPAGDAASTEAYASIVRAGQAFLAEIDRSVLATLDVKHSRQWDDEVLVPLVEKEPRAARAIAEGALMRMRAGARTFERYRRELGA